MFVVGPALGYILGGLFLSVYTDFHLGNHSDLLSPSHPAWVGAWWVGFLVAAAAAWAGAAVLALFPPVLPGAEKHNQVTNDLS